jgi:hypothetical protein
MSGAGMELDLASAAVLGRIGLARSACAEPLRRKNDGPVSAMAPPEPAVSNAPFRDVRLGEDVPLIHSRVYWRSTGRTAASVSADEMHELDLQIDSAVRAKM